MTRLLMLVLSSIASLASATELPIVKVTGLRNGDIESFTHEDGREATALGLAISIFSTARLEFDSTRERWDAAKNKDHVRISFDKPLMLRANTTFPDGKIYTVDEILIATTSFSNRNFSPTSVSQDSVPNREGNEPGKEGSLIIRSGEQYFSFIKYEGILVEPLITIFGPRDTVEN